MSLLRKSRMVRHCSIKCGALTSRSACAARQFRHAGRIVELSVLPSGCARNRLIHQGSPQVVRARAQGMRNPVSAQFHPTGLDVRNYWMEHQPGLCMHQQPKTGKASVREKMCPYVEISGVTVSIKKN